jgi:hypothetical protein
MEQVGRRGIVMLQGGQNCDIRMDGAVRGQVT